MQDRLDRQPDAMKLRRQTVEHPFGTLKAWMGATHFLTKRLPRVSTEMSLHVLAYNLKRVMHILGIVPLMQAMRTLASCGSFWEPGHGVPERFVVISLDEKVDSKLEPLGEPAD
jgi:hypothetical protein